MRNLAFVTGSRAANAGWAPSVTTRGAPGTGRFGKSRRYGSWPQNVVEAATRINARKPTALRADHNVLLTII